MMMYENEVPEVGLRFNGTLHIASARSRDAKTWNNQTISVREFVAKLAHTTRTPETVSEYMLMPKSAQDEVKDVGGFVGGMLKAGRRLKSSVANRHILSLDADYATPGFLDGLHSVIGHCAYTVYSTHKHTPESPRLRVIVYPDRPLLPDEYQAVMRLVAQKIGIDFFDDTTYDVNRLMYWPSSPVDGEFVFLHNDAEPLSVNALLAEYGPDDAWRDSTLWPVSSRETENRERKFKKQADPLEKKGVVGAYCRVMHPIQDAIEKELEGIYKRETDDRYTYVDGSTTKGLVIYDGRFAFSNHGTDPARGQTCNAFDLVRIHRYGHMDDAATPGTPTSKLPSYQAMVEHARAIKPVMQDLIASKMEVSADDFDFPGEADDGDAGDETQEDTEWLTTLQAKDNGDILATFLNATTIMHNDPKLRELAAFDEFSMVVRRSDGEQWGAVDSYAVRKYIGRRYVVDFPESKVEQAIEDLAHSRSYHPVAQYVEGLEWDGVERVEALFIDYLGCEDNAYTREACRAWFVAAVSRVLEPGYKFDNAVVLGGKQGIGKSTFIRALAGDSWFGELSSFDPKIAMEEITGKWLIEISELGATNRSELEQQKSFLSATSTRVRPAYARHAVEYKRQCVFMGTTNQTEYLKDSTGNRRWWPIECGVSEIDIAKLREDRDQIWAEAFFLYAIGTSTLLGREARAIAEKAQEDHREDDAWQGIIEEWLNQPAAVGRYDSGYEFGAFGDMEERDRVCVAEVWNDCLGMKGDIRRIDSMRIGKILDGLEGWSRKKGPITFGQRFGKQRPWMKVDDPGLEDVPF